MKACTIFLSLVTVVLCAAMVSGTEVTIVTFNSRWLFDGLNETYRNAPQTREIADAHLMDVANLLRPYDADIIALQEIEDYNMLKRLADLLGGSYELLFVQGNCPTGQDVGILSRYPVLDFGRTDETVSFPIEGSGLSCLSGSVGVVKNLWANLDVEGTRVTIITTHLLAYTEDCNQAIQREAEAIALRNMANDVGLANGREIILLGDLNDYDNMVPDRRGSESMSIALKLLKDLDPDTPGDELVSTSELLSQSERYTAWWDRDQDGVDNAGDWKTQIDFILVSPGLFESITEVWIDHASPAGAVSDHWPTIVTLDLPPSD
jgi:endonuclease/exonuclease/phosphatase family metal-dependent hydrolase